VTVVAADNQVPIPAKLFEPLRRKTISRELAPFLAKLASRLEIPRRLTVTEWADRYRKFDKRTSAYPRFSSALQPAMRAVQDACGDPAVRTVTERGARQVGKTTAPENAVGSYIGQEEDRGPVLWVESIKESITKPTFRARIDSLFECETVREHSPERNDDRGSYKIVMKDMMVVFAWAGSQASQSGDAMRYVILNELGIYRKHTTLDAVSIASKALTTWRERGSTKLIETSTPEEEGDLLDREIKASDLRYYHVPCPHCGGYQVQVFKAEHASCEANACELHWAEDAKQPDQVTAENVWYDCIHCGGRMDETHRLDMIAHGVWAREGSELVTERKHADGKGPFPSGRCDLYEPFTEHVGFHFPCFISRWHPWWRTAQLFLKAVRSGDVEQLRGVVRFDFAEPWREKGEAPKANVVRRCIDSYTVRDRAKAVPAEAEVLGLFLGVDVQESSVYYVVRAFGPSWRSWLLDAGELIRELGKGSDLAPVLDGILSATYGDWAGDVWGLEFGLIDAQYDTNAVYDFCLRNRGRIAPGRGGNREFDPHIKPNRIEPGKRRRDGKQQRIPGEVLMHTINPWRFSEALVHSMRQPAGSPAEWRLPADIEELDPRYLAQVTNQKVGRSERGVRVWKKIDSATGDHYFDAEKLCRAAAMSKGIDKRQRPAKRRPLSDRRVREGSRGLSPDRGGR